MPTPHETPFKAFYSWQSDLPESVNLQLIRNSLSEAANKVNADHELDLHVVIDEATRNVPGSPNIAESIFSKIREADVFVCDLTKVAEMQNAAGSVRTYCNPNVAIELGYAVRFLGWGRIIIVFNKAYGIVPDDLPFDARGHRVSVYQCQADLDEKGKPSDACKVKISSAGGDLRETLVSALKRIAKDRPKTPQEAEITDPQIIRRARDLEQLKKVFYWINLNMMDQFISRLLNQGRMRFGPMDFSDFLGAVLDASNFHFYDTNLKDLIVSFHEAWRRCFTYAQFMEAVPNGKELFFRTPGDMFTGPEQESAYNFTVAQARPLREQLDLLLSYVREHYIEINPAETGTEAVANYYSE